MRSVLLLLLITTVTVGTTSFVSNDFQISKNLEIFANLLKKLHTNYVDDIKTGELVKTGIDAMLDELDPYTVFIPESKVEDYQLMTTGEYGGIGSTIQQRGEYVQIARIYEGFAADKAGLKPGDKILMVDDKDVKGKNTEEVSNLLKGQAGSEISVTIKRHGKQQEMQVSLTREKIKVDHIPYAGMLDQDIAYIKLTSFTRNVGDDIRSELVKMKEEHQVKGVILDLRNNGGGLLSEAVKIVNIFVPKGELVVETRGKLESKNNSYRTTREPVDTEIPLTVLVNGNSASASEIVAGAIQDLDRGVVLGETTFGKGLVQNILPLSYNTRMKVTVAKYYIPSGRCIQSVDYSRRKARQIPDSLKHEFKTKAGRTVLDGDGIYPDKDVKPLQYSQISRALLSNNLIFDFVTQFYYQNDSIQKPEEFEVTDDIYAAFSAFLDERDFSYQTNTEKRLDQLRETAEEEEYLYAIEAELDQLKKELHHDKSRDLQDFRPEIERLLRTEIVGRYYYQTGEVITSLRDDKQTLEAISLLKNAEAYQQILQPE